MNFGEIVFRGWTEANDLHNVSIIEKVVGHTRLGTFMSEKDLDSVKKQNAYLATYYFREARKAEAEYYPTSEFFEGCHAILEKIINAILHDYYNRKLELSQIKAAAQAKKIKYNNDNGLPYEQRLKETIESCDEDLKSMTTSDYAHPIHRYANSNIGGHIRIEQLNRIADALKVAQQRCVDANSSMKTDIEPHLYQYPELFKEGGFGLFTYLFDNITQFKPKTRATVLFHSLRNECFTDTATHALYIEFLTKQYKITPSKISKPNFRGQDFAKDTLPKMVSKYKKENKEVFE